MKNGKNVKTHIQYRNKNNQIVPGVTTILGILSKNALIHWAWDLGMQKIDYRSFRDDKADIGTLIHEMVFAHLKNKDCDISNYTKNQIDLAENGYLKYLDWEKRHKLKPILLETPLVSEAHRYGGTPDNYCVLDGILTLVDYKSGKGIYDEMFYQLAAYEQLINEYYTYKDEMNQVYEKGFIQQKMILRIGRDETEGFEVQKMNDLSREFQIFLSALNIYNLKKAIKKG